MLKEAADADLVHAVREVAGGGRYVHPTLGARLAQAEVEAARRAADDPLSEREREVLRLLALGHTNQEIARQLYISVRTAETHRAHIMQKLRAEHAGRARSLRARERDARRRLGARRGVPGRHGLVLGCSGGCADDEHGARRMLDHVARHASHDQRQHRAVAVSAHGDESGASVVCERADALRRVASEQVRRH